MRPPHAVAFCPTHPPTRASDAKEPSSRAWAVSLALSTLDKDLNE